MHIPPPILELWTTLTNNLACWVILAGLNVAGFILQKTPLFPNRFNWLIPWLLYGSSIVLMELLVPVTVFPPTQEHPRILLGILGVLFGAAAYFGHDWLLQWLLAKAGQYLPGAGGRPPPPVANVPSQDDQAGKH